MNEGNCKTACPCGLPHYTRRMGVYVVEMAGFGPYKIWNADLRSCMRGHEVLAGFGDRPLAEHFETEKFASFMEEARKTRKLFFIHESIAAEKKWCPKCGGSKVVRLSTYDTDGVPGVCGDAFHREETVTP